MIGTDVIDTRVRVILDDTVAGAAERWSDATLIAYLNDGVQLITDLKPEALLTGFYTLGTITAVTALVNTISIGNRYLEALVDYVCARALQGDAQDERDLKRAATHMQAFVLKAGLPNVAKAQNRR